MAKKLYSLRGVKDIQELIGILEGLFTQLFSNLDYTNFKGGRIICGNVADTTGVNLRVNGSAGNTSTNTATLTNAPATGNPTGYLKLNINGTDRYIPYW